MATLYKIVSGENDSLVSDLDEKGFLSPLTNDRKERFFVDYSLAFNFMLELIILCKDDCPELRIASFEI